MLDDIVKAKNDFFNRAESVYLISTKNRELFEESYKLMEHHVKLLDSGAEVELVKQYKEIEKCIDILMNVIIEHQIEDHISKDFIDKFSFFVFNWNENVYHNKDLHNKCKYIQKNINSEMTLGEQLFTAKNINEKLVRECNVKPKSFEMSEHYFNIIKDE